MSNRKENNMTPQEEDFALRQTHPLYQAEMEEDREDDSCDDYESDFLYDEYIRDEDDESEEYRHSESNNDMAGYREEDI